MTRLPQEILDVIIDHLALQGCYPSTTRSLKACSLSAKSLRRRSRGHLFSHVALKYNTHHLSAASEFRRLHSFKALLDGDRDLVHCIKSLELWVDEFSLIGVHDSPLSDIITILYSTPSTSLHALTLRGSQYRPVLWDVIPDYLQAALYSICQSGSLHSLEFQYFRKIPLQILWTTHPALQSLSIVDVTFDQLAIPPKFSVGTYGWIMGPHVSLKHLSVDRSITDFLSVIEEDSEPVGNLLEQLTSFHIIIDHEDCRVLPVKFLTALGDLTSLSIFTYSYLGPEGVEFDLCEYPFLTSLTLQFEASTVGYAALALNHAFDIGSQSTSSQLEHITINVDLATSILDSWNTTVIKSAAQRVDWDRLDIGFSHERYPKLRRCDVIIKWAGLNDNISRECRETDKALCGLLQHYLSPTDRIHIHPVVRVSIDLDTR